MNKKKLLSSWLALMAICMPWMVSSCNDLPTEVGIPIDTLEFYSINSVDDPSIIIRGNNFTADLPVVYGSGSALIGHDDFTSSSVFLGFAMPPDTLGNLDESSIMNPRLVLHFDRYAYGDSNSTFSFDVYRTFYELPVSAKWEWAYGSTEWPESDKYLSSDVLQRFDGDINLNDTNEISIDLSSSLIKEYLDITQQNKDTVSYGPGEYPYGLALVPSDNNSQFRRLFTSRGNDNKLNPKIRFEIPVADSTATIEMDAAITGQLINPVNPQTEDGELIVGSGVRRRSQLYFDLSAIPENADIVSSSLWLYNIPSKNRFGNLTPDSIILVDSLRNPLDSLISPGVYTGKLQDDGQLYVPTLTAFMNGWNFSDGMDTISLLPLRPVSRLDRLAFHSPSSSDSTKRPKLVVIYQIKPGI